MVRFEDDCVGCPQGCICCGRRNAPHLYCDECGEEYDDETLYDADGKMLCADCIVKMYKTVRQVGWNDLWEAADPRDDDERNGWITQDD